MSIKDKLRNKILGYRATSDGYIKKLRELGASIGEDVVLYRPYNTTIDVQNPHLITIGNHVMITGPATILTHDYSWSVLKAKYGYITGNQKPVKIGNNVFIGWGATILSGTTVGDNTVIGANSVVSGYLEPDSVYAGNPARRIMSIDEYYKKRLSRQLDEAYVFMLEFKKRNGRYPERKEMNEYFFLFTDSAENLPYEYKKQMELMGTYEKSVDLLNNNNPEFKSYDEFIKYCEKREKSESVN
ncbi:MAG: acyltransferase [Ruminococcus sp.]|nr:acyltransferase [Ruminococcus sp.]